MTVLSDALATSLNSLKNLHLNIGKCEIESNTIHLLS